MKVIISPFSLSFWRNCFIHPRNSHRRREEFDSLPQDCSHRPFRVLSKYVFSSFCFISKCRFSLHRWFNNRFGSSSFLSYERIWVRDDQSSNGSLRGRSLFNAVCQYFFCIVSANNDKFLVISIQEFSHVHPLFWALRLFLHLIVCFLMV